MLSFYPFLKNKLKRYSQEQYFLSQDKAQARIAEKSIAASLKINPSHRLSKQLEKRIEVYAKEKLGSVRYSPMLKANTVYQGKFVEGWIPDNYFERHVLPRTNGFHRGISDLRHLAKRILNSDEMPDLGYYVRGCWMSVEGHPMSPSQAKEYFFSRTNQVIVKLNSSMRGQGFFQLDPHGFDQFMQKNNSDFVVQFPINQHEWYAKFTKDSVATLRITTVKPFGSAAKSLAAFIRFGREGIDRVTANSRLVVGVFSDGRLGKYSLDSEWDLLEKHPDSGIAWEGNTIPEFDRMVKICEELHDREGTMEIIGWDLVMDEENRIQIMEWNTGYPGIVHSEMTTGPNFLETDWGNLWKNQPRRK